MGSTVFAFHATDADEGPNGRVSYSLAATPFFALDKESGLLTLTRPLDFETEQTHVLDIKAQDEGSLSASFQLEVQVEDTNDSPPLFRPASFNLTVPRSAPEGSHLLHFNLSDADSAQVQNLTVSLSGDSADLLIVVGDEVTLKRAIPARLSRLDVFLTAFDGVHSATAPLTVRLRSRIAFLSSYSSPTPPPRTSPARTTPRC